MDQSNVAFILEEQRRFAELPLQYERLMDLYRNGSLAPAEYLERKGELDVFSVKERAFRRIVNQYRHLMELKETKGINGSFVNELSTNFLFRNPYRDLTNGLTYTLLLLLSLSVIFPLDYQNGMVAIVRNTRKGRLPLFVVKHIIAGITALAMMLVLYTPAVLNTIKSYPAIDWEAPVQSILQYKHLTKPISIREFAVGVFGLQYLGAVLVSICTLVLSILLQKRTTALLLASTVFLLPFLALLTGFGEIRRYSFAGFFTLFDGFAGQDAFLVSGFYAGTWIGVSALACFMAWKKYINPERWRFKVDATHAGSHQQNLQ